uniref:GH16 domain-containing protein n=1 Tax=Panagrolaimus sp. ES5 TaxID=591445 RepID=A0AC34FFJ9_9BILA
MGIIWEDNFDQGIIDPSKWAFDIGTGPPEGWGNAELQFYTNRPENARVENGILIIEARKENFEGRAFTSARLKTKGLFEFTYGTVEARIKLPFQQKGLWPAFWTLGSDIDQNQWPKCGEIDILEAGSDAAIKEGVVNRRLGAAIHWDPNGHFNKDHNTDWDLNENFRTYKLHWTETTITASIDDVEYFKADVPSDAFRKPHFLLLNLAVGGNYTGIHDPNQINPPSAQMQIEYIKVYQN